MQAFRELIKGWLGKFLLGLVVVVFGAFGTESLLSIATKPKPTAEVNGEPITQQVVERAMEVQRERLKQRLGDNPDPSLLDAERLRPQAIEALVEQELIVQYANESDFGVSKASIAQWVMEMPQFQRDGAFSEELLNRVVRQLGYSIGQLYDELSKDYVTAQVRGAITSSAFLTQQELDNIARLESQTRDIGYITLDHEKFLEEVEITDAALTDFYDKNSDLFKSEERAKWSYLEIKADDYIEEVADKVDEASIKAAYEADMAALEEQEERHAAHILVEINDGQSESEAKERIEAAAAALKEGKAFADVVAEYSEDVGSAESGGDLGFAKRGDYVGPFEEALYALKEGEISEPVLSEFGFHIIQLKAIKQPEIPPFEQQRDELEKRLARELAEERYLDELENLRNLAYESDDLEQPASSLDKTIQHSDWIFKHGQNPGLFAEQSVISAAFTEDVIKDGYNSEVVEISSQHAVVLRLVEHEPEKVKSLNEVRSEVEQAVKTEKAVALARQLGQKVIAKLRHNSTLADVEAMIAPYVKESGSKASINIASDKNTQSEGSAEEGDELLVETQGDATSVAVKWVEEEKVGRFSAKIDREVTDRLFRMKKPAEGESVYAGVDTSDQNFAIVRLSNVHTPDAETMQTEAKMLGRFLSYQFSQFEFKDFVAELRAQADVVIN